MSIRFQADNDLNGLIVTATLRREPAIDFRTASRARFDGLQDLDVLERAAEDGRILVTHDKRTMPRHFFEFLSAGNKSPGVLVVIPQNASLSEVVETILLIWGASRPEDWRNTITKIPF